MVRVINISFVFRGVYTVTQHSDSVIYNNPNIHRHNRMQNVNKNFLFVVNFYSSLIYAIWMFFPTASVV
jgi:hypothetical protein